MVFIRDGGNQVPGDSAGQDGPAAFCRLAAREALMLRGMDSSRPRRNLRRLKMGMPDSPRMTVISDQGIRSGGWPMRNAGKMDI